VVKKIIDLAIRVKVVGLMKIAIMKGINPEN